jgi:1-acyl-sn-glycerol-3-phosphate acyltransferase
MRQRLARFVLRVSGWRSVGEVPREGVLVGAPHTSNWDFVVLLLVMVASRLGC